jgi:hypothetical protein
VLLTGVYSHSAQLSVGMTLFAGKRAKLIPLIVVIGLTLFVLAFVRLATQASGRLGRIGGDLFDLRRNADSAGPGSVVLRQKDTLAIVTSFIVFQGNGSRDGDSTFVLYARIRDSLNFAVGPAEAGVIRVGSNFANGGRVVVTIVDKPRAFVNKGVIVMDSMSLPLIDSLPADDRN